MSWQVASFAILGARPRRRVRLVRALAPSGAARRPRRGARRARRRGPRRARADPERRRDDRHRALLRLLARRGARVRRSARSPALVSNFWLGQGPWTPWQMAGWGLVGLAGAALADGDRPTAGPGRAGARLRRRRARLRRAARLLGDGHLRRRAVARALPGALQARGIPFNVAHAVGNVAFALVAGPAFVRMLTRFRRGSSSSGATAPAAARDPRRRSGRRGGGSDRQPRRAPCRSLLVAAPAPRRGDRRRRARWLARAQNPDGGFGAVARRRVERRDHRLGDARARGRGAQPARRRARAANAGRLPAPQRRRTSAAPATSSARSSPCAAPGSAPRDFAGTRPRRRAARPPRRRRLLRRRRSTSPHSESSPCAPGESPARLRTPRRVAAARQNARRRLGLPARGRRATPTRPAPCSRRWRPPATRAGVTRRQRYLRRSAARRRRLVAGRGPARSTPSRPPGPCRG